MKCNDLMTLTVFALMHLPKGIEAFISPKLLTQKVSLRVSVIQPFSCFYFYVFENAGSHVCDSHINASVI